MYVRAHVCMYVCVYVCMHAYMHACMLSEIIKGIQVLVLLYNVTSAATYILVC